MTISGEFPCGAFTEPITEIRFTITEAVWPISVASLYIVARATGVFQVAEQVVYQSGAWAAGWCGYLGYNGATPMSIDVVINQFPYILRSRVPRKWTIEETHSIIVT